jgi:hypothetical protein
MKKQYFFMAAFIAVIAAGAFWGCQKDDVLRNPDGLMLKSGHMEECEPYAEFKLIAGQHTEVGKLVVSNDETTLTIEFVFDDPNMVEEVHLWVGTAPYVGTIAPGQFPYKDDEAPIQMKWEIDLEDLFDTYEDACDQEVYILAHAALYDGETVWSEGPKTGQNWSMYSIYTICCDFPGGGDDDCWKGETAFGGNTGFNVMEPGAWWFVFDTEGPAVQKIYAGQKEVAGAFVTYDEEAETLTITLGPNMKLEEGEDEAVKIQAYNEDDLPTSRPAAGSFKYKGTDLVIDVEDAGGPERYYVIHLDVIVKVECPE